MDEAAVQWLEAELTKINFLLEGVWALVAHKLGATPELIDEVAEEALRQFRTMPGRMVDGSPAPANDEALTDQAALRISQFFESVRRRIETAEPPSS